ncbi:MAG: hypothetical protein IPP57_17290 [Candidatus Obscuribacter sp.]|nr:hypothetical protein [Candidatus Obscuribacter sp.]
MLRNSVDLDELKNRQTFPKNNYFCYKWRIKDHFNRSIDRQQFHLNSLGANNDKSLMNDRIMQLYKSSFGTSRKDLIVDLAQEAMSFLEKRRTEKKRAEQTELMLSQATTSMVDFASNILLGFSTELNSLMGLSELFITAAEPESKKLGAGTDGGITHVVQSSFSTHTFRLAIEGRLEVINFYLVPADTMLTLNEIARHYEPLERWRSTIEANSAVTWHNDEGVVTRDVAEVICAELLRYLIAATQERLAPAEQKESADEFFFEMSAPAPWEVEIASRGSVETSSTSVPGSSFAASSLSTPSSSGIGATAQTSGAADEAQDAIYPELDVPVKEEPAIVVVPEQFPETHPHYFQDYNEGFPKAESATYQYGFAGQSYDVGSKSMYDLPCVTQAMIAACSKSPDLMRPEPAKPAVSSVATPVACPDSVAATSPVPSNCAPGEAAVEVQSPQPVSPQSVANTKETTKKSKSSKAKSRGKRRNGKN